MNHTIHDVEQRAKRMEHQASTSVLEYGTHALKLIGALRALELRGVDSALDRVGLRRRAKNNDITHAAIWFAGGAVLAGGAVWLLASPAGKALRQRWFGAAPEEKKIEHAEPLPTPTDGISSPHASSSHS